MIGVASLPPHRHQVPQTSNIMSCNFDDIDMSAPIYVKNGIGWYEYTQQELRKEIEDFRFLKDAFLVILNEELTNNDWDIPFDKATCLEYARDMYKESGYSDEYLDRFFGPKKQQTTTPAPSATNQ